MNNRNLAKKVDMKKRKKCPDGTRPLQISAQKVLRNARALRDGAVTAPLDIAVDLAEYHHLESTKAATDRQNPVRGDGLRLRTPEGGQRPQRTERPAIGKGNRSG
jgi:hypothetical protein